MRILHSRFYNELSWLVNAHPDANEETIRLWLESNICRCMSYEEIHHTVKDIFKSTKDGDQVDPLELRWGSLEEIHRILETIRRTDLRSVTRRLPMWKGVLTVRKGNLLSFS